MNGQSDDKIMEMITDDSSFDKGFELLVRTYQQPLYWHIRRIVHFHEDADDVIQNTFIKVFKNIKGFKRQSKLYTWLYRIASNESITFINKKKKNLALSIEQEDLELQSKLLANHYFDGTKIEQNLIQAVTRLPDKQKQVFNLRYYDELSYKDMSEVLDTSVGALKASYHHAVKKIENYLKNNIDNE